MELSGRLARYEPPSGSQGTDTRKSHFDKIVPKFRYFTLTTYLEYRITEVDKMVDFYLNGDRLDKHIKTTRYSVVKIYRASQKELSNPKSTI